jgi:hypothetical protein
MCAVTTLVSVISITSNQNDWSLIETVRAAKVGPPFARRRAPLGATRAALRRVAAKHAVFPPFSGYTDLGCLN